MMSSLTSSDKTQEEGSWENNWLQIGDEFALQTIPIRDDTDTVGYVTGGVTNGSCFADFVDGQDMERTNPPHPVNARFIFHCTQQYSASKKLRDYIQAGRLTQDSTDKIKNKMQRLKDLDEAERVYNEQEFENRTGQIGVFGNVVQLLMSVNGNFLRAEKHTADEDTNAMQCNQVEKNIRSKLPWFRIMPGFATRNEGDRIRMGDTIILESIKMPNMFMHCNDDGATPGTRREVNIASEPTRFLVVPVAKYHDTRAAETVVRGGEFVQLYQKQKQAYLYRDKKGNPAMFRPKNVADRLSTRADLAWQVEVPRMKWSGAAVKSAKGPQEQLLFSLKDSMSGLFLRESDKKGGNVGVCCFQEDDDSAFAQWELVAFDTEIKTFTYQKTPFMLKNAATGRVLHCVSDDEEIGVGARKEKTKQVEVIESGECEFDLRALDEEDIKEDDLFVFRPLSNDWTMAFQHAQHEMLALHEFKTDLQRYSKTGAEGKRLGPTAATDFVRRKHLRKNLDDYGEAPVTAVLQRFLMTLTFSNNKNPLTREGLLNKPRQRMLSEFRLVDFLVNLIDRELFKFIDQKTLKEQRKEHRDYVLFLKYCFRLMGLMCTDNPKDCSLLFRYLETFFVSNLGCPWNSSMVISRMFSGSIELIRRCSKDFVTKIWEFTRTDRDSKYVESLCVLLSKNGVAIKSNQDLVIDVITNGGTGIRTGIFSGDPSAPGCDWATPPAKMLQRQKSQLDIKLATVTRKYVEKITVPDEPLTEQQEQWLSEFHFHVALVRLAALLCARRHRASIDVFLSEKQFGFTYENTLRNMQNTFSTCNLLNQDYGSLARLEYTNLMMALFVDREPYELQRPDQAIRALPFIRLDALGLDPPNRVDPYAGLPGVKKPTPGFKDLKAAILQIVKGDLDVEQLVPSVASENTAQSSPQKASPRPVLAVKALQTRHNRFLCAVVDLTRQLLLCGIYDDNFDVKRHSDGTLRLGAETMALAEALLPVLDGRTDETTGEEFNQKHPERSTRFFLSYENSIVMEMKRKILDVLDILFKMRASTRIDCLLSIFYADADNNGIADILEDNTSLETMVHNKYKNPLSEVEYNNPLSNFDGLEDTHGTGTESISQMPTSGVVTAAKHSVQQTQSATFAAQRLAMKARATAGRLPAIEEAAGWAKKAIDSVVVFDATKLIEHNDETIEGLVSAIFVDLTRYDMDPKLAFGAFDSLIYFVSQDFVFQRSLESIRPLVTPEKAKEFVEVSVLVSEYRRLQKWLHQEHQCKECIQTAEKLVEKCRTRQGDANIEGQEMLRNLNIEEYTVQVMNMRLQGPAFQMLMIETLELVRLFCYKNAKNQAIMAVHIETVFLRLLHMEEFLDETAHCIREIVADNESLSEAFSGVLVSVVGDLAKTFGRRIGLLSLLQSLLIVNGKPVLSSQLKVCRGAMSSRDFIEVSGELEKNEWGDGRAITRLEALKIVLETDYKIDQESGKITANVSIEHKRCKAQIDYYTKSLVVLSECAGGKNPTTELLCAAIIPLTHVVERLFEIYDHPDLQSTEEDNTGAKNSTMAFFRAVFVDTTSEHILRQMQRQFNGVWSVDRSIPAFPDGSRPLPIGKSLVKDLEQLRSIIPKGKTRTYIFEQVVQFFVQYACVIPMELLAPAEALIVGDTYERIIEIVDAALACHNSSSPRSRNALLGWDSREVALLQRLQMIAPKYLDSDDDLKDIGTDDIGPAETDAPPPKTHHERTWDRVVEAVESTLTLGTIKATDRKLGVGIMAVGQALWDVVPDDWRHEDDLEHREQEHFAGFLVKPLLEKLQSMEHSSNKAQVSSVLMMVDAVRSIPYGIVAFDEDTTKEAFQNFLDCKELDSSTNPDIARVQIIMIEQGWGLLCFQILGMDNLPMLRRPALRLLLALTGGGNPDVQDELLRQLDDTVVCPEEICAVNFRRLLRNSIADLKFQRRRVQAVRAGKGAGVEHAETGYALEVLRVMRNMTLNDHVGMQMYLQKQPGHPRNLDLIADVVAFMTQIERDLRDAVHLTDKEGVVLPGVESMMQQAFAAFRVLISMCSGPNAENQRAVVYTDILTVLNRILEYCDYKYADLEDLETRDRRGAKTADYYGKAGDGTVGAFKRVALASIRPRRKVNRQISRLLLTLLEGKPPQEVVLAIVNSLNWGLIAKHLLSLRSIMTSGFTTNDIERVAAEYQSSSEAKNRPWSIPKTKDRDAYLVEHGVPRVSKKVQGSVWLQAESYKNITIVIKCRQCVPEELLGPLTTLLEQRDLMKYFSERLGEVEVVRSNQLERLFYWMPAPYIDEDDRAKAMEKIKKMMTHVSRDDDETKLSDFVNMATEVIAMIDSEEKNETDPFIRLTWAVNEALPADGVTTLSLIITLICIVSFDHDIYSQPPYTRGFDTRSMGDSVSHYVPTYGRLWAPGDLADGVNLTECYDSAMWTSPMEGCDGAWKAWQAFVVTASAHLFMCGLGFYTFLAVRVPVLLEQSDRMSRLKRLKLGGHTKKADLHQFLACTVQAYGFDEELADVKSLKRVFSAYGVVTVVQVMKVKGHTSSWAIISFSDPKALKKVAMGLQQNNTGNSTESYIEVKGAKHRLRVYIRDHITEEYIEESATLKKFVVTSQFELLARADEEVLFRLATALQHMLNVSLGRLGRRIPLQTMVILRRNPELWSAIADIVFSVMGFIWSPLFFSYHLVEVGNIGDSAIVIKSITTNKGRLLTTVLLALFALYLFALMGLLLFDNQHITEIDNNNNFPKNPEGPCANLLTCFVSYSYSGLMQEGVSEWLVSPQFPEHWDQVPNSRFTRIMFEVLFMMVTSCAVIAIITGIICDTFGELRMKQDEAAAYRASTCFITGIPYTKVPYEKGTDYFQYLYLLLYLRRLDEEDQTPLEEMICDQVNRGEVDWLPMNRCITLETKEEGGAVLETDVKEVRGMINTLQIAVMEMETKQNDVLDVLNSLDHKLGRNTSSN